MQSNEGAHMSSRSQIESICRKAGKVYPHPSNVAWTEIRQQLEPRSGGIFGTVQEFERHLQARPEDENPVSSFAKVKPPPDFVPAGAEDSALVKVLDDIAAHTQQTVFFVGAKRSALARALQGKSFRKPESVACPSHPILANVGQSCRVPPSPSSKLADCKGDKA
jgi:hypothetical protein